MEQPLSELLIRDMTTCGSSSSELIEARAFCSLLAVAQLIDNLSYERVRIVAEIQIDAVSILLHGHDTDGTAGMTTLDRGVACMDNQ